MGISIPEVADRIYSVMLSGGQPVNLFLPNGEKTANPRKATRFVITKPYEIIVRLDADTDTLKISSSQDIWDTPLFAQLTNITQQYLLNRDYQIFGKSTKIKKGEIIDAQQTAEVEAEHEIMEQSTYTKFAKPAGSTRTSYQSLTDSISIIVKHRKRIEEEKPGSRSRNIDAIYIQRGGERFRMAENSMIAARAMARHLENGGEPWDDTGNAITEATRQAIRLGKFINYMNRSGMLNETNEIYVNMSREHLQQIRGVLAGMTRPTGYAKYAERIIDILESESLEELEETIETAFTQTNMDKRVVDAMGDVKGLVARLHKFQRVIDEAIEKESFPKLKNMLQEMELIDFTDAKSRLGYQVSQLSASAKSPELSNYLGSISEKISSGGDLNQHEYGTVKRCLFAASGGRVTESTDNVILRNLSSKSRRIRESDEIQRRNLPVGRNIRGKIADVNGQFITIHSDGYEYQGHLTSPEYGQALLGKLKVGDNVKFDYNPQGHAPRLVTNIQLVESRRVSEDKQPPKEAKAYKNGYITGQESSNGNPDAATIPDNYRGTEHEAKWKQGFRDGFKNKPVKESRKLSGRVTESTGNAIPQKLNPNQQYYGLMYIGNPKTKEMFSDGFILLDTKLSPDLLKLSQNFKDYPHTAWVPIIHVTVSELPENLRKSIVQRVSFKIDPASEELEDTGRYAYRAVDVRTETPGGPKNEPVTEKTNMLKEEADWEVLDKDGNVLGILRGVVGGAKVASEKAKRLFKNWFTIRDANLNENDDDDGRPVKTRQRGVEVLPFDEPADAEISLRPASRGETQRAVSNIRPTDQMMDIARGFNPNIPLGIDNVGEPDYGYDEPVTTENLPAVISTAVAETGMSVPPVHRVSDLPGNVLNIIRHVARDLFGQFTRTPVSNIFMVGNIGGTGPNSARDVQKLARWIANHGRKVTVSDPTIDFEQLFTGTGYTAHYEMYTASGVRWLVIAESAHGQNLGTQYIYMWPERDSIDSQDNISSSENNVRRLRETRSTRRTRKK
jgi:hypothetical protein